jgi:hypothetical protein
VAAPDKVIVTLPPEQITGAGGVTTRGNGFTVTVIVVVPVQPVAVFVPTTVYVVVTTGFAVTLLPVVALKAVAGDHTYVSAPETASTVEFPTQIETSPVLVITGDGFITTFILDTETHPAESVTVTVYVVVDVGDAITVCNVEEFKLEAGDHE